MNTPYPVSTDTLSIQHLLTDAMHTAALNQALALHQSTTRPAAIVIGAGLAPDNKTGAASAVFLMPDVCGRALIVIENPRMWPRLRKWLKGTNYTEQPAHRWQSRRALALQSWTETIANSEGLAGFAGYWQFASVQNAAAEAAKAVLEQHGVECHVITERD